ncbi:tyrosine-type recombinase/integrase [Alkalihalobacillus trypoxylicola]|uniref:Integrase n=1 Tax=Alkalihalobacillus trypoxylicola TaxID=519424 RepID=A0A162D550_9BACI|nr:tyrosine-type recombinase/integrase [Alkalihalobacillus trypoxylicola]KYG28132.1 integrase [Alkalihalobacillus trypoxylicola]
MKGYFRKRGNSWSFTIDVGRDPETGKRKQKTQSGFKTKKEAQSACASLIDKINKGYSFDNHNVTVGQFIDHWLEHVAKRKVTERTLLNYTRALDRRIRPYIGTLKLTELKLHHGQKLVTEFLEEGKSERYIEYTFTLFRGSLNFAVKTDILQKNPLEHLELPRPRQTKKTTWSAEEIKRFMIFSKTENPYYMVPLLIAARTGMRRGEVLGLRWDKVDFERKKITVEYSLTFNEPTKQFIMVSPKTKSSYRQISIDDDLTNELKRHRKRQLEMKMLLGADYDDSWNLVCCSTNGRPMYGRSLAHHFDHVAKKAGLKKIRIHDLRHSHATMLLREGVNPKIVSERLGHSSIKMTLDVYSHVTLDMQEKTADIIKNILNF